MSAEFMPHSLEAEEGLLSCLMLDGAEVIRWCVQAKICAASFYDPKHGVIYRAILALHSRNQPTDVACVAEELKSTRKFEKAGGLPVLTQVSQMIPTTAQARFFLDKVREQWILRELIRFGGDLAEQARNYTTGGIADLLSPKVAFLNAAMSRVLHANGGVSLAERIQNVSDAVERRNLGTEDRSGWIYTDFKRFDGHLRPMGSDAEDHVILIGGGSGHGKSALMRQLAGVALRRNQTVVTYTRETSVNGFAYQLASNWARVDLKAVEGAPPDLMLPYYAAAQELKALADKRLFVYMNEPATPLRNIEDVTQHARAWSQQHGAPHLMIVDYLQLFELKKGNGKQREAVVAAISHELQALQRELGCVLMVAAQYNETGLKEMRSGHRDDEGRLIHRLPGAGDFRESQAMFHDADRVLALYRPPEDCRGTDQATLDVGMPEQWICQLKRRYGGEGVVKCWFEKRFLNFREIGKAEASAASAPRPDNGNNKTKDAFRKGAA